MYRKTWMKSRNLIFPEKIDAGYLNFKKDVNFQEIFRGVSENPSLGGK